MSSWYVEFCKEIESDNGISFEKDGKHYQGGTGSDLSILADGRLGTLKMNEVISQHYEMLKRMGLGDYNRARVKKGNRWSDIENNYMLIVLA